MCLKVQGLLGSCRLAFQDSCMKQGKLNCRRKMDFKFMVGSCFLCSKGPVTGDTIRDTQCLRLNVNLSHWHGREIRGACSSADEELKHRGWCTA